MHRITKAIVRESFRLDLTFADGTQGTVDLSDLVGRGVFAAWEDYEQFRQVSIGDNGELVWPGDIDLCPDSLYMQVTGKKAEEVFPSLKRASSHA